jgi:hypothetical protein
MPLRPGHIKLPKTPEALAAEAARAAAYDRKQKWKELPGNRYTPGELQAMTGDFAGFTMRRIRPKRRVMYID